VCRLLGWGFRAAVPGGQREPASLATIASDASGSVWSAGVSQAGDAALSARLKPPSQSRAIRGG